MPVGSEMSKVTPVIEKRPVVYAPTYEAPAATPEGSPAAVDASSAVAETVSPTPEGQTSGEGEQAPSKVEQRQQRLEESKMARKAREELRRAEQAKAEAKVLADKAEQFNKQLSSWQKDPLAALQGAGIDAEQFYRQLTQAYLNPDSVKQAPQVDPIEAKVKEYASPYIQRLDEEHARAAQHNALVAETQAVHGEVLPIITNNKDKYEAILAFNENNEGAAAVAVYNKVKSHWFETAQIAEDGSIIKEGEVIEFEDAANQLEDFYASQVENGINMALGMKRFSSKYGQKENLQPGTQNPASSEQSKQTTKTLTNSRGAPAGITAEQISETAKQNLSTGSNPRLERLKKKHNL